MKKNSIIWAIVALAVIAGAVYMFNQKSGTNNGAKIKIGAILPLTGDLAQYGQFGKQGLEIALQEFREDHPDVDVSIIIEDDKGQAKTAMSAVKKLRDVDGVDMIIGSMSSGLTIAVAPEMEKSKVVMMAPTSTASEITYAGDYIFRVCVSDAFEGSRMAEYIQQNFSDKKLGVVYINNDYGVGLKKNFIEKCLQLEQPISYETGYSPDTKDFKTIINNLKSKNIDLIYIVAQKEQIDFFTQCKQLNYKPQITASTMLEDEDLITKLGSYLDGALYTYRSYDPERNDSVVSRFVNDSKKRYGKAPEYYAASTFDATKVCLYAQFNYKDSNLSLKDFLYTIKDLHGVMGVIEFDKNGDVTQGFSIKKIDNGSFCFVN